MSIGDYKLFPMELITLQDLFCSSSPLKIDFHGLDTWITDEIKNSKAYQMYFKYSTGLNPPKKSNGRIVKEGKTTTTPQKPTKPKKKPSKWKLVLRDEYVESKEELEHMPTSRKWTSRAIAIQEPPSVPVKQAQKRESIFQHQTGGSSEGAGLRPENPDELTRKYAYSNEGDSTSLEVPDESKDKSKPIDDLDSWGSIDEEEYLLSQRDEKPKDIPWKSTDEDEFDNDEEDESDDDNEDDEEEDDKGIDIKKTNHERADTNDEDTAVKEALEKNPHSLGQSSSQGQSAIQAVEPLSKYELNRILNDKMLKRKYNQTHATHQELFDELTWSMLLDEANIKKGDKRESAPKKRDRGDDQDKDPLAGSNQGKNTKKRKFNDFRSSKKTSTAKESSKGKSSTKTSKFGKSADDDVEETYDDKINIVYVQQTNIDPKITKKDWFKDSTKLESSVVLAYDKDVVLGISHWRQQRQQFYRDMINMVSKHKVKSTMRILSIVSVQVEKRFGYGYLKKIVVRRADQKLHKFKKFGKSDGDGGGGGGELGGGRCYEYQQKDKAKDKTDKTKHEMEKRRKPNQSHTPLHKHPKTRWQSSVISFIDEQDKD
nr:hypothetical protein [Tanacetum cinerariifolium]